MCHGFIANLLKFFASKVGIVAVPNSARLLKLFSRPNIRNLRAAARIERQFTKK
jgi:hypothetical protein